MTNGFLGMGRRGKSLCLALGLTVSVVYGAAFAHPEHEKEFRELINTKVTQSAEERQEAAKKIAHILKGHRSYANGPIQQLDGDQPSTPLVEALRIGNVEAARVLLEYKADPNAGAGKSGQTPLEAAMNDLLEDSVKQAQVELLLSKGAQPKHALHRWAARKMWKDKVSYFAVADALVEAGASVDQADDLGMTPLRVAVINSNSKAVEKLLAKGAKVDEQTREQAKKEADPSVLKLLKL